MGFTVGVFSTFSLVFTCSSILSLLRDFAEHFNVRSELLTGHETSSSEAADQSIELKRGNQNENRLLSSVRNGLGKGNFTNLFLNPLALISEWLVSLVRDPESKFGWESGHVSERVAFTLRRVNRNPSFLAIFPDGNPGMSSLDA